MRVLFIFFFFIFTRPCASQFFYFSGLHSVINTYDYKQSLADISASHYSLIFDSNTALGLSLAHSPLKSTHVDIHIRKSLNRSFDASTSVGLYKSWFPSQNRKNVYNDVLSLNVNLGYKFVKGEYIFTSSLVQHALFIKTGALLYYKKFGFNFSYRLFGIRTSKIYLSRIGKRKYHYFENFQALKFASNPKFYSSIDLRFILKFRKILFFVHMQKLDITPIYPMHNRETAHFGIEYNLSSLFYKKGSKKKRRVRPKKKKR